MDVAATVARYEQALQLKRPLLFRILPLFSFFSTSPEELLREKLFHLVEINNKFHILDVETAEDAALRIEFDRYAQARNEWMRYDRAFRAMHPDLIDVYDIMRDNMTLEEKLEQLKSADMGFNFMAEYEMQQELERLRLEESFEQLERAVMAENEFLEALHRLQMGSDVTGPAHNDN